jgi:hypothetical protein
VLRSLFRGSETCHAKTRQGDDDDDDDDAGTSPNLLVNVQNCNEPLPAGTEIGGQVSASSNCAYSFGLFSVM